jgi:hypothetical protein
MSRLQSAAAEWSIRKAEDVSQIANSTLKALGDAELKNSWPSPMIAKRLPAAIAFHIAAVDMSINSGDSATQSPVSATTTLAIRFCTISFIALSSFLSLV